MRKSILFRFLFAMVMPFMAAIKNVTEGGAGSTDEDKEAEKALIVKINNIIEKHNAGFITEKTMLEKLAEVKEETDKALLAQSEVIRQLSPEQKEEAISVISAIKAHVKANKEIEDSILKGENIKFKVDKVAGSQTVSALISTNSVAPRGTSYSIDSIFARAFAVKPKVAELMVGSPIDEEIHTYTEQKAKDGSPDWKQEGATADLVDYTFETSSSEAKEIKVRGNMSKKAMKYISNFMNQITELITRDLLIKVSNDILYGDNVANTYSVKGLTKYDLDYPATSSFDDKIISPTKADVLLASKAVIMSRNADDVNLILMNPIDVALLEIERDKQPAGQRTITSTDGLLSVGGVPVLETNEIAVDAFLIGDRTKFDVHPSGGIDIEIGNEGDDLKKGNKTIYVSQFYHVFLKSNYTGAFIYDTFANVQEQIEKTVA